VISILVVSLQTMISMSLQDEYDVTAVAPADLTAQIFSREFAVTVIDAGDVDATLTLISELPRDRTGPLLLLAHDEPSAVALDAVKSLRDLRIGPPLSGASLRDCLHGLAHVPIVPPPPAHQPPLVAVGRTPVPDGLKSGTGELQRRLQGRTSPRPNLERAGTPADLLILSQGTVVTPAEDRAAPAERDLRRSPVGRTSSTSQLVDQLLSRLPQLLSVGMVSRAIAEDACARLSGSASAVLARDGEHHCVTAGVGLRPVEHRLQLSPDHWLVREVALNGHGLMVEDTDIVRRELAGAPLAAAKYLIAAPVPDVGVIIMVARYAPAGAFVAPDLSALADLAVEALPPLREALALAELLRQLRALDD